MNGFINGQWVVKGYIDTINQLFQDEGFLNKTLCELKKHPNWAFTEMRAYLEYKKMVSIRSIRLNSIINQETFDDCIYGDGQEYNMKVIETGDRKKLFFQDGLIYEKH